MIVLFSGFNSRHVTSLSYSKLTYCNEDNDCNANSTCNLIIHNSYPATICMSGDSCSKTLNLTDELTLGDFKKNCDKYHVGFRDEDA